MIEKWDELKKFINNLEEQSYEESVWITCRNILDEIKELESEELK